MRHSAALVTCVLVVCGLGSRSLADGELPADQQVVFCIHESPGNSESPIRQAIILQLTAQSIDDGEVGWQIAAVQFHDISSGVSRIWTQLAPVVNSSDGLWWVTHNDPLTPDVAEFAKPPHLQGQAAAAEAGAPGLSYDLHGKAWGTANSPFPRTGCLDFLLQLLDETQPLVFGAETPVPVTESDPIPPT